MPSKSLTILILMSILTFSSCSKSGFEKSSSKTDSITEWFSTINDEALKLNVLAAEATWKMSIGNPDEAAIKEAVSIGTIRSHWRSKVCEKAADFRNSLKNMESEKRQLWLLCRGVDFTSEETEKIDDILNDMQTIYTATKVCITTKLNNLNVTDEEKIFDYLKMKQQEFDKTKLKFLNKNTKSIFKSYPDHISDEVIWNEALIDKHNKGNNELTCFSGEPDLERVMSHSQREEVLKWAWLTWRQATGPPIKHLYSKMVSISNEAACRKGYSDMGEVWREELEIPDLVELIDKLYDDVKDLYKLLHAVVNHFLSKKYGHESKRFIEAHLTGNMWGQNWESILGLIYDLPDDMNLNYMIKKTNWTSKDMVKRAEDFYASLGLPLMTKRFWKYSYFGENNENTKREYNDDDIKCHGTAANMYQNEDYRMMYCANLSMEDFYVIHHELGHIQYFMAYDEKLPTLFMEGTNSAFQESIGDAVMLAVMAPQHLLRLGLIKDQSVYVYPKRKMGKYNKLAKIRYGTGLENENIYFDDVLMMFQGLSKIPQIPFGYIIDKYRWDIFSEKIKPNQYNTAFWNYVIMYQGLLPPSEIWRGEEYFDAAAKYHIPDNTPYIRYFLSSFLQIQIFKGMCQLSLFGTVDPQRHLPMPLHRCDIYGSKKVGNKLREIMEKGSSIHWSEALYNLTGERTISSKPFLEYFQPLEKQLRHIIKLQDITMN